MSIRPCPNCGSSTYKLKFLKAEFKIVKCRNCQLVFLGNPPENETLYDDYHVHESLLPSDYSRQSNNSMLSDLYRINEQRIEIVKSFRASGQLLDVGCGSGYFTKTAADNGYEVLGIDIAEKAVNYVSTQFDLSARHATLENLIYEEQTFDIITLWHVLEHFLNPFKVMGNIYKLLKPQGICLVEVPNLYSLKFLLSRQKWQGGNHPLYHRTFFSKKTLEYTLKH